MKKSEIQFLEIIWPGNANALLPISRIVAVELMPKFRGGEDAVSVTIDGMEKKMLWQGARAEELYCRIRKILYVKTLQF